MRSLYAVLAVVFFAAVKGQIFAPSYNLVSSPIVTPGIILAPNAVNSRNVAHRAVVENAAMEQQIPSELLNPFYKNPAIVAGLAKESWFTNKEFPVLNRAADKIPRSEIYKIINRAGWA